MRSQYSYSLFIFGGRKFVYQRLAQGLNRSLPAFTSVNGEYSDLVVKADRCAHYVDISVAAHTASELIENLDRVFKQIEKAGLKLSIEKCQSGKHSLNF